jgi:hypothetical protein
MRKLLVLVSLLIIASMALSACQTATPSIRNCRTNEAPTEVGALKQLSPIRTLALASWMKWYSA